MKRALGTVAFTVVAVAAMAQELSDQEVTQEFEKRARHLGNLFTHTPIQGPDIQLYDFPDETAKRVLLGIITDTTKTMYCRDKAIEAYSLRFNRQGIKDLSDLILNDEERFPHEFKERFVTILARIENKIREPKHETINEDPFERRVIEICDEFRPRSILPEGTRERILEGGMSPEQAKEALDGIIRKNLLALEKMRNDGRNLSGDYRTVGERVRSAIFILKEFPGSDTLARLREYALSRDYFAPNSAVHSYIAIAGGDSVPFLQEIIAEKIVSSHWIASHLERVIRDLKKEGKDSDVEKFHIFLLEQLQAEQDWQSVEQLDAALCATLDDYPQSIQRKQAIQRFANMPEDYTTFRQRHSEIQADVDKTPADKRTDLSKRFKLTPVPQ